MEPMIEDYRLVLCAHRIASSEHIREIQVCGRVIEFGNKCDSGSLSDWSGFHRWHYMRGVRYSLQEFYRAWLDPS